MENSKRVGIAINPQKAKKHISPALLEKAAEAGIEIRLLDAEHRLEEQEPFDVVLHKIRDPVWHEKLKQYQLKRPGLRIVDSFEAVMQLTNRISMLDPLRAGFVLKRPDGKDGKVQDRLQANSRVWDRADTFQERRQPVVNIGVPTQFVIEEGQPPEDIREATGNAGLRPPYLGKPLYADGREGSHGLLVIKDEAGLLQLARGPKPAAPSLPIVLQEYVPHGACLFKVYVMGPITILVRRPSLRLPVAKGDLEEEVGSVQSVGRVSAYYSESEFGSAPQGDPPHWAIQALAQHLRRVYSLTLFNFDLIQPDTSHDLGNACVGRPDLLLLDINAFPGFEKLPDYEELFVLYLQSLFEDKESHLTRFVAHSHVSTQRDLRTLE